MRFLRRRTRVPAENVSTVIQNIAADRTVNEKLDQFAMRAMVAFIESERVRPGALDLDLAKVAKISYRLAQHMLVESNAQIR